MSYYDDMDKYTDHIRSALGYPSPYRFNSNVLESFVLNLFDGKVNFVLGEELFKQKKIYPINFLSDSKFELNVLFTNEDKKFDEISRIKNYRIAYLLGILLNEIRGFSNSSEANEKIQLFYSKNLHNEFITIRSARLFSECLLIPKDKLKELILNSPFSVTDKKISLYAMREIIRSPQDHDQSVRYICTDEIARFFEVTHECVISRLINLGLTGD